MGDDVDHALGEPEVLHPRVAAVRRARRLVRDDLREVEPEVPPAVHARGDLRPDHAAERLVARERAGVVERLRLEAEQRAVRLDRDLDVTEPALGAVGHREVELGPPLRPLDRAVQLPREQAARDELRVRGDLVAEPAADVLGDEAELVDPAADRGRHHDRGEAGELVVREDRPLPGAAVVLDERAVALERGRVEAVEVQLGDLHDVVGLRERRPASCPTRRRPPRRGSCRRRCGSTARSSSSARRASVITGSGSYSTSTSSAASRASSRVSATTIATGSPTNRTRPTASA